MMPQQTAVQRNSIYNADCIQVLQRLPAQSVDLIIADPPYYRMKGDFDFVFQSVQKYLAWCASWATECYRGLKPTGAFYCWGNGMMIDKLSVHVFDPLGWVKRNLIVWNYGTGKPGRSSYRYETEFLWFYSNPQHELDQDAFRIPYHPGAETDKRKNPKGKTCGNVWECLRKTLLPRLERATGKEWKSL